MAEPPQQPILLLEGTDSRNHRVMSQLTDSLLSQLTQLNPSLPHSTLAQRESHIQSRLQHLFHNFHTPTHPPYALMINKAIAELNDESGSTSEAISEFVKREYEDLPWAHSKILSIHLGRMCEIGEIACNENGRYMFPVGGMEKKEEKEKERCKGGRKRRRGCRSNREDTERGNQLALLDSGGTEEASTQVAESGDHLIGSVEEKAKVKSEKGIQLQMVSSIVCAEGSSEGIELSSQTQLQPQKSADIDTDVTTALVCANVDDGELPLDYNQGNTDGSLDENPIIDCLDQIQPMRKRSRGRGRPRKSETDDVNWQEKPLLLKHGPTKNKRNQNGQTRGPVRPPRLIQDTEQCEDKLKKKGDKLRKKEKLRENEEELMKKDQAKLHDPEEKLKKKDEAKLPDCEGKLMNENQAGRGRGRGRLSKPKVCDTDAPVTEATTI